MAKSWRAAGSNWRPPSWSGTVRALLCTTPLPETARRTRACSAPRAFAGRCVGLGPALHHARSRDGASAGRRPATVHVRDADHARLEARAARPRASPASLDVVAPEPLPGGHPLWRHPEVLITPHAAVPHAFTADSTTFLIRQLRRYASKWELLDTMTVVCPAGGGHARHLWAATKTFIGLIGGWAGE
ncbi:NAD(P)-dependent oxidoreductase [Streptomyces sp. NPDC048521]|uniref:NAD(P)-dependent oxidoreductase n=1 Tax=Streptomyces sp. NPDC048521 TaxID=3365566 RepID=UPI00371E8292